MPRCSAGAGAIASPSLARRWAMPRPAFRPTNAAPVAPAPLPLPALRSCTGWDPGFPDRGLRCGVDGPGAELHAEPAVRRARLPPRRASRASRAPIPLTRYCVAQPESGEGRCGFQNAEQRQARRRPWRQGSPPLLAAGTLRQRPADAVGGGGGNGRRRAHAPRRAPGRSGVPKGRGEAEDDVQRGGGRAGGRVHGAAARGGGVRPQDVRGEEHPVRSTPFLLLVHAPHLHPLRLAFAPNSRRVYDAINVLMAMDIISKEKKEIRWKGLPSNATRDMVALKVREPLTTALRGRRARGRGAHPPACPPARSNNAMS